MIWRILAVAVATTFLAFPAQAKKHVYAPTVHEGEREIAYYIDWQKTATGNVVGHELELEYAFTRDSLAIYGVWQEKAGQDRRLARTKLEWIHQFGEQGEYPVDIGTYVEYQSNRGAGKADKVEFKALLQKDWGRFTLTGNGVFKRQVGADANGGIGTSYATRIGWRNFRHAVPALELYGSLGKLNNLNSLDRQSHLLGPVVDLRFGLLSWQLGALFGLTDGSEDVRLKTQIAWEWY